mmetsp:Transcript_1740/g.3865  ORF Transcript_1740/g.3865 Transcript_1740/m.3865 type:complete len:498 (+) Transcript_1740:117-1610(+)|eukprot:CAMPEP_0206473810 /NCGR_PEP_ID=MMETSP0324_2-20121206/33108_1 /ASSEMBLY_ACC=CAM_ASM_000836 /TAXON_ID=2866 /ORGANISM="Crypthecodinium cohnii, Strain Seligo" /LENGTH=497 /DNA_ID=CAMNT_0053948853 /DNA_START=52 /DNA_END=1545 /DNA_ORIENTATION=-
MATPADAAREFITGPRVLEAARLLIGKYPLPSLCEALANAKVEDTEPLLNAISSLAQFPEVREAFFSDAVAAFLQQGARSPDPSARAMVAKLLQQLAVSGGDEGVSRLSQHGLLDAVEGLLLDEDTGTAEAAAGVLRTVIEYKATRSMGLEAVKKMQQSLNASSMGDTQRIRILNLFVVLGRESESVFSSLEESGAYKMVLDSFITDDLLLKLNAVELMDALGSFLKGQEFLSRQGVPEKLAENLEDPMCDDSIRLCVVRLLGLIIRRTPEILERLLPSRDRVLAQHIAGMLESSGSDTTHRMTALNAWANISVSSVSGLAFWLNWEGRKNTLLSLVASTNNEVCKGAMAAWSVVLEDRPPYATTHGGHEAPVVLLWDIAEKELAPIVLKNLISKPFPDVRFHAWNLLALLVRSKTVAQMVMPSDEMREILLDFSSETESPARIGKHSFVKVIVAWNGEWLASFLDEKVMWLLDEYAKQGPFWVPHTVSAMVGDQAA